MNQLLPKSITEVRAVARSGLYFLESIPLTLLGRLLTHPELPPPTSEEVRAAWTQILELHRRDASAVAAGTYNADAFVEEHFISHTLQFLDVMRDGIKVAWRMKTGKNKDFSPGLEQEGLPEYYARNFHFQTDGYLSEASARRYDHQVEILFSGAAGAMRRLILPVLKGANANGHWLELGCGTGSATRPVLSTFPKAQVTAVDLSHAYLKVAQDRLREFKKINFLQGDGTHLDFKDQTFDAIYSVFVMHELPAVEREKLVREAYRLLKPGGLLVLADSLQLDDVPQLNWALKRFPQIYHEPFYRAYLNKPLENLLSQVVDNKVESTHAFFTKVVSAYRN